MRTILLLFAATAQPTYDYGYGRAQTYDTSKTYYQQAGAATGYTATYDSSATAAKVRYIFIGFWEGFGEEFGEYKEGSKKQGYSRSLTKSLISSNSKQL